MLRQIRITRAVSMLLIAAMLFAMLPAVSVRADNTGLDGGGVPVYQGSGTEDDPYIITTADELNGVRNNLTAYYKLGNDIDLSSYSNWAPIGGTVAPTEPPIGQFSGQFDGQGHRITNMQIHRIDEAYVGLFSYVRGGTIKDVILENVDIEGHRYVGGLVGAINSASLSNIAVSGVIKGPIDDFASAEQFGGIVGGSNGLGSIINCYADVNLTAYTSVGGLVGYTNNSTVEKSYATGNVDGINAIGGLVGKMRFSGISNSYATGKVDAASMLGGLVGYVGDNNNIATSYAVGKVTASTPSQYLGGLIGLFGSGNRLTADFYDQDTTTQSGTGKGEPKSTADMQDKSTFISAGWDFSTVWTINEGQEYPKLQSFNPVSSYHVIYHSNGAEFGLVPIDNTNYVNGAEVIVKGNFGNLEKSGKTFDGWNTEADGSGTKYKADDRLIISNADVELYAQWMAVSIPDPVQVTASPIVARYNHSLVLKPDGTVWTWGNNDYGQLGVGDILKRSEPVQVNGLQNITSVAAGETFMMALQSNGSVWIWGNNNGKFGIGTTASSTIPVLSGFQDVKAISAGTGHAVVLKQDGTVWASGDNSKGQLGDGNGGAAGNPSTTPVQVKDLDHVAAISAGATFTLALKEDGTVWAWGANDAGQLGDTTLVNRTTPVQVTGLSQITGISAGPWHSFALSSDGTVWGWGFNRQGQVGDGTTVNKTSPVTVFHNAASVSAGSYFSTVIAKDRTVWGWGFNNFGALGNKSTGLSLTPVQVLIDNGSLFTGASYLSSGTYHSLVINNDGDLWVWGDNSKGQLGNPVFGASVDHAVPLEAMRGIGPKTQAPSFITAPKISKGTQTGSTTISGLTVEPNNHLAVQVSSSAIGIPSVGDDAPAGYQVITSYTQGSDIVGVDDTYNKYLGLYEIDADGKIVKFTLITLNSSQIQTGSGPLSDTEAVANAKAALEIQYPDGEGKDGVSQDLTLPGTGENDTTISWSSSNPDILADDGTVTRPSFTAGDKIVTLTATITKGEETDTKVFTITVKAQPATDAEAVESAKATLEIEYPNGESKDGISQDLTLPATGENDTTISWSSSDPNVLADNGTVTRPSHTDGDKIVTLTATITKGQQTETKTFTITIKAQPATDAEAAKEAKAALEIEYPNGESKDGISQDLTLPATGENDTTISWSSSDPNVLADNGTVTRPSYTDGDKIVTLTATITKGQQTETKTFTITIKAQPATDAEAAKEAKAALEIQYPNGESNTGVSQNLTLPTTGENDTTISWSSSDPNVLADNGTVTRPSYTDGDKIVTLTATITKGQQTETKTFTITIKAQPATDAEAAKEAKAALEIQYPNGESKDGVSQDLTLPATGENDTTISWSSSDPNVLADNGTVTRPSYTDGDKIVTLTATITKGQQTETKTFTITVKAQPATDAEAAKEAKAALEIQYPNGESNTGVSQNLTLPTTGENDTTISWSSSDPNVLAADGTVNRPSYTAGDKSVTLTATITKGQQTETKTFTITVKAQPATDAEAAKEAKAALEIQYPNGESKDGISQDLTLPATGENDTTISWSSSDPNVLADNGTVTRPSYTDGNKIVTLTATITKGQQTETKTFTITVKAQPATDAEAAKEAKAALEIQYPNGESKDGVSQNLTLPTTGENDTTISWSSSDPDILAADGTVNRPSYTAGDKSVTLTATITKGQQTETKTFTIKVKAQLAPPSSGGGSSSPSTSTPNPNPPQTTGGVTVYVNGKAEDVGKSTTTTVNNQKVTTILLDPNKLDEKLAEKGTGVVVTVPFTANSDVAVGELNGQMVKKLEQKQGILKIETPFATYTLPASQIHIDEIIKQLGQAASPENISIRIELAPSANDTLKVAHNAAEKGNLTLIAEPLDFTVRAVYADQVEEINHFNAYVERMIAIPQGVDPSKITTGVVLKADGTLAHVPTKVTVIDGKYYAVINSLTNSSYSVIYNVKAFNDTKDHWAKASIEDMASRLIVNGVSATQYNPDHEITRAEFTAIVVRALGLRTANKALSFSDMKASDWSYEAVSVGSSYGLIQGYADGTFGPDRKITREEAMAILYKAMILSGMDTSSAAGEGEQQFAAFTDANQLGKWATEAAMLNVRHGIIEGSNHQLRPQDNITRAETAAIVQRMLKKAGLI